MRPETFARVLRFSRQCRRRVRTGKFWASGRAGKGRRRFGPCWRGVCLVSVLALILVDVANLILAAGDAGEGVYRRGAIAS